MSVFQLRTFSDIVTSIREELQLSSTDTTAVNRIKRDVNMVYDEIISRKKWPWLTGSVDLTLLPYVNAGTASVTQNNATVTLTVAPMSSKSNYFFSLDGYAEIYTISSHVAGSVTLKLANEYTGLTNATATYKIWTNRVALPTDCKETNQVWHDTYRRVLENIGRQEYRKVSSQLARNEGPPAYYYTGDYSDPAQTSSIVSLPAISTRASVRMVKTIVFAATLPTATITKVSNGDPVRWNVTNSGHPSYNGNIIISSISSTNATNDTITYTGVMEYTESAIADANMSITQLDQEQDYDRYRELFLYPCLSSSKQTLHVDYYKDILPLENDSDEPVIPKEDRMVLRLGALSLAWSRVRNAPEAERNRALYEQKISQMEGKWQDSLDKPQLITSKNYLSAKRNQGRKRAVEENFGPLSAGGGGAGQNVTGTANTVAVFGTDGVLIASNDITTTELDYLNNVTSNVQTQLDTLTASIASKAGLLNTVTLLDNKITTTVGILWDLATYDTIHIRYSLNRGTSNKAAGTLAICTNGSIVTIAQAGTDTGTLGVIFTVDISAGNIRLLYTTTSTGTDVTMKYFEEKWLST